MSHSNVDKTLNNGGTIRVVFAGTPEFAASALETLLNQEGISVVGAYSQPDRPRGRGRKLVSSPVKILAEQHNIPVFQPIDFKQQSVCDELTSLHPDTLVVAAYGLLLPQNVLDIPRWGCINIHASLLPRWRGAAPVERAIEAGDIETGVSIMQMDKGLDTGDILSTRACPITSNDTGNSIRSTLAKLGGQELISVLQQYKNGSVRAQTQDNAYANYAKKITKPELAIDWSRPANEIDRKIRAFYSGYTTYSELNGQRIKLGGCELLSQASSTNAGATVSNGEILSADKHGVCIACAHHSAVRITALQLPGSRMLPVRDIMNSRAELFAPGLIFSPIHTGASQ